MMQVQNKNLLEVYKDEMYAELNSILSYWIKNTCDTVNGGFIGRIDENNISYTDAPKGAVLNSRILWTFSTAYSITKNEEYLHIARVAYNYLVSNFIDTKHGGVYWLLNADGIVLDSKKQLYATAFALYGCCAYFTACNTEAARDTAIQLYHTIEQRSYDEKNTGYLEAFTREWKEIADLRLSKKDANEKKTMNTHLHILEAYSSLYRIWPGELLKEKIQLLIHNFLEHIIDKNSHHLILFFDEEWNSRSTTISYGHDIEAAWLIQEAAAIIQDEPLIERSKDAAVKLSLAAAEGIDVDGGLWYESENDHLIKQKHWWPQAEAMVGFFNAWQVNSNEIFLQHSLNSWHFIKNKIIDKKNGEWLWGIDEFDKQMPGEDKVGLWKCPYHNGRACIEIIHRIRSLTI